MNCPRCYRNDVSIVGDHYVCNNPDCVNDSGERTQFYVKIDSYVRFPYNQIFVNRNKNDFYRKPYLQLPPTGLATVTE